MTRDHPALIVDSNQYAGRFKITEEYALKCVRSCSHIFQSVDRFGYFSDAKYWSQPLSRQPKKWWNICAEVFYRIHSLLKRSSKRYNYENSRKRTTAHNICLICQRAKAERAKRSISVKESQRAPRLISPPQQSSWLIPGKSGAYRQHGRTFPQWDSAMLSQSRNGAYCLSGFNPVF